MPNLSMVSELRKAPLYEQAYSAVRARVRDGTLRSGEIISELRLAEMLGMGRTPVREAVRRLMAENFLEPAPGGGLRIPLPVAEDFAEVYLTRAALEAEATRIATTVATPDFLHELGRLCAVMQDAADTVDVQGVQAANTAFHRCVVDFAANRRIYALLASFEHIAVRYRDFALTMPVNMQASLRDHHQLVGLMRDGDAEAAAECARAHVLRAGGRVIRLLEQLEGVQAVYNSPTALFLLQQDDFGRREAAPAPGAALCSETS